MPGNFSRTLLCLERATFRLGDRLVFPQTSWTFKRNEQWGVIGANGSGKSVFADCLRGQLPLVAGNLRYGFQTPAGMSPEDLVGYAAFEERRLELHGEVVQSRWNSLEEEGALRVREYLGYERVMEINPFEVRDDDQPAQAAYATRLRRAASLLEIGGFWDRTLLSLSNGERQRVELARALSRRVRLLILDEPFAGLDREHRMHFRCVLERVMATRLRVLFISSRGDELPSGITHVLELENSRIIRTIPLSRFTSAGRRQCFRQRHPRRTGAARRQRIIQRTSAFNPTRRRRALVDFRKVTVRYGRRAILENLSWTIYQGENWALLGPNGSGKSTILSLILGDNPQAYGNEVIVFGRRRGCGESIWEIKRRIGWVSPELQTHFSQDLTCLEVALSGFFDSNGLYESPTSIQRRTAHNWLERFGLGESGRTPLAGLSAGWQRMALLARALVKSPELLLLDEPCQGLDENHCALLGRTVEGLIQQGGVTVVYVTHREEEIPGGITRVLRLGAPS